MVDPGQVYDTIQLDVRVGGGFAAAQGKITSLVGQLEKLGKMVTPIRIDTTQIDQAIAKLQGLSRGIVPPTTTGRAGFVPPGIAGAKATRERYAAIHRHYAKIRREEVQGEWRGKPQPISHVDKWRAVAGGTAGGPPGPLPPGYKTPVKDIGTETPKATENLAKLNKEMGETATRAADVGKTMPQIPAAMSGVTNSLKAAVPAAEAARVKLDALKLTGGNMKPALAEAATAQTNLKNAIVGATGKLPANSKALKAANSQLRNLNRTMDEAKGQTNAYTLSWKNMTAVMGKVAFWMVATGAIYGSIRAFKSALDIIIKVDHAMADIRKVYQGAPADIRPLRDDLIGLNVALGGNVEQAMEAAVGWARLGYKRREIVALMRTSMLAMNIAELNAAEATKLLTAAMQQFKIPATGAITVLDSWNELSNRSLATTRDLGDAVSIAGATFQQTGDSIHYLNAITATLVQTMAKSGRQVGTAMRTIGTFMYRPRTIKKVEEITGVQIEKAPTPERLPDEDQAEHTQRMRDNMKSQSEVLGEVAASWDNLTERQQINLAQSMAGVRRYNYFMALMGNYDMVMNNLLISINSVGSAERENAIYMNTLQKQIERLKSSFTKLYVAAGDGGLAGVLKAIVKVLTFLVSGFAGVNFTVPLITIAVLALANGFKKLITIGGGFRNMLKGFRSPMGQFNLSLLAVGAAFAVLESAAASAHKRLEEVKAATDDWIASMDGAAAGIKTVADNVTTLGQYKAYMELKYEPGSPEYIAGMEKYTKHIGEQAEQLMLLEGITYDAAKAKVEAGDITQSYATALGDESRMLDTSLEGHNKILDILERFNAETPEAEENMSAFLVALKQTGEGDIGVWGALGSGWDMLKKKGPLALYKEVEVQSLTVGKAIDTVKGKIENLNAAKTENAQEQMDAMGDQIDEVSDSSDGAGTKIDRLQQMMGLFAERLRPINRDLELVNHLMEFNSSILDEIENKYGAAAYATDGYLTTLNEQSNYLEDTIARTEAAIIKDQEHIAGLTAARDMLISSGAAVKDYKDNIDSLTETLHQDERALQALQNQLVQTNNRGFAAFVDLMEKQRGFGRAPDVLSRVLPSRADAVEVGREIGYIMDDLEEIGKTTGKDIIGAMSRWGIYSNSIYMSYDQIKNVTMDINATEEERVAIEQRLGELQNINIAAAQKLNQEYERLAGTFQNIVDEGLFGIIMGEQTALDLAKELGREWAEIGLKTLTQPATEMFGAGMGGAAYFMKHGKLPPSGGGGISDVQLKDGRVPVYDEALAGVVAAAAGGPGVVPAGMGPVAGAQGAGGPGAGGPGALGMIMPVVGGMATGGLMGAGGGGAGAGFGAAMGGIGAAVSLIPGWGQIAGAGISLLGLLGNLFGGTKHEEEDPYARQQAAGMGERSVSIGSAGTVINNVHMTIYYESLSDRENVSKLYDDLEEEGMARGYQVTGSAAPATV